MTASTFSEIIWPRAALAGCVFCTIVRDTRGVALSQGQRFNFFPGSPLCCVSWLFAGDWHLIETIDQTEQPWTGKRLPRMAFSGAQLGPLVSWNPGETFAVTIAFYPDAFSAMTGLDLAAYTGQMVAADGVLPLELLEACRKFNDNVSSGSVLKALPDIEDEIASLWSRKRPHQCAPVRWMKDWSAQLVVRAALSGPGRSTRQIARRVKSWTGVSERDLNSLGHAEQLYAKIYDAVQNGNLDWAEVAASSGFADQAHMIKRLRKHTGFTPEQLRQKAATEEALWAYRLLGQYFTKPALSPSP